MTPLGHNKFASYNWHLGCLFNSVFMSTTQKLSIVYMIYIDPLSYESTGDKFIPRPQDKCRGMRFNGVMSSWNIIVYKVPYWKAHMELNIVKSCLLVSFRYGLHNATLNRSPIFVSQNCTDSMLIRSSGDCRLHKGNWVLLVNHEQRKCGLVGRDVMYVE